MFWRRRMYRTESPLQLFKMGCKYDWKLHRLSVIRPSSIRSFFAIIASAKTRRIAGLPQTRVLLWGSLILRGPVTYTAKMVRKTVALPIKLTLNMCHWPYRHGKYCSEVTPPSSMKFESQSQMKNLSNKAHSKHIVE